MPDELTDAQRGLRLQKVLADAGVAARRTCEQLVAEGRVRVNGKLVTGLPAWVDPEHDKVTVDGRPVPIAQRDSGPHGRRVYILLHKPRHVITTTNDPEGRKTVLDLINVDNLPRVFPVGRLDHDTTGLILLTNDGDLAQRLTHPRFGVMKQYIVSIRGRLTEQDITILQRGLYLADAKGRSKRAKVAGAELLGYGTGTAGDRTRLSIHLREGQNREIRRLLARLGYKVRRLQRVAIGPLSLRGLPLGQWRMLTNGEVKALFACTNAEDEPQFGGGTGRPFPPRFQSRGPRTVGGKPDPASGGTSGTGGGKPRGAKPSGGKPAGGKPSGGKPRSFGGKPSGDRSKSPRPRDGGKGKGGSSRGTGGSGGGRPRRPRG